jgi:hypothetical protein
MTQRNAEDKGQDEGNSGRNKGGRAGRHRNDESASSYAGETGPRSPPQEPGQRTGSRHWMRDPGHGHAGYGDYGTRDYDPRPEATRPRDFRDYGRGDYRGNVGPGGFGYAESNYGPTRYGEAFGRAGREGENPADAPRDMERERRSFIGRGPRNYRRSDERIRETICERLTDDPQVDASEVTVEVKDGVVTLAGTVPERRMKHRIEDIAADAARDNDVRNEVSVKS